MRTKTTANLYRVVRLTTSQLQKLNTNTRYLDETILNYSQALADKLPEGLDKFFFTNSGSESNDLALRLARHYANSLETIVLDGAYHGHLISLIEISPYKYNGNGGQGPPDHVHAVPTPDPFRGKYRGPDSGRSYADEVKKVIEKIRFWWISFIIFIKRFFIPIYTPAERFRFN